MFTATLRKLSYAWLVVQGLFTAVAPKTSLELNVKLWGFPFENAGDLEPKAWYLRTVRAAGVGMAAAGLTGLFLEGRVESEATAADETDTGTEDDDGAIEVEV